MKNSINKKYLIRISILFIISLYGCNVDEIPPALTSGLRGWFTIDENNIGVNISWYEVEDEDYTLLLNSGKENMEVVLPPASNNEGRILILKKTNHDKYKLNSGVVRARDPEGKIDISDQIVIKMNYSLRMIQSDGKNWWIIGSKGT